MFAISGRMDAGLGICTLLVLGFALAGCVPPKHFRYSHPYMGPETTVSARGVMPSGASFADVALPMPDCGHRGEFLLHSVHAVPEINSDAAANTALNLPNWAVSVPLSQRATSGVPTRVALTAIGDGPEHIAATLATGQSISSSTPGMITAKIRLLGNATASDRFEFSVHVTGSCGKPYVAGLP